MESRKIRKKFRNNKWLRYGVVVPVLLLVAVLFFLVRGWFAPRVPKVPSGWRQEIVGYWAFEQPQNQQFKDTANGNHGQLGSSFSKDRHDPEQAGGKLGSALKFKGEDYGLVPYDGKFDFKEGVTLEVWVKARSSSANEDLWLSGWKYRKRVVLENTRRKSAQNAQVKLTFDTKTLIENDKLQSGCKDLRFTGSDKTTKLDWFIEAGCNSTTTEVWVKVPLLKAESKTPIYIYYGNFEASRESGFQQAMETPPGESWSWPPGHHWREEKAFGVAIDSENVALIGGYRINEGTQGQEWRAVKLNSDGRGSGFRNYRYSSGANRINEVAFDSEDRGVLVGFDTEQGDSQWRIKRRGAGRERWNYTVNPSPDSDRATAVAVDSQNNIIVGGFDYSKGDAQWRVEKLSSKGEKLWTYTKNYSSGLDKINDVAVDSEDNILVVGVDKEKGNDQWRVVKLSPKGDLIFAYLLDVSNGSDVATEVGVDPQNNIIVGGFDFKRGNFQWRVVKLNSDGERLWKYENNPSSGPDQINGLAVDEYGNVVIGGFDYSKGDARWRVERLSSEGEKLWTYTDNPSSGLDVINGVAVDSKDNIVLAGFTGEGTPKFLVKKISERKYYDLEPEIEFLPEHTFQEIPSLIVGKLGSYGLRVERNQVTAFINENLISTALGSGWNHLMLTYNGSQQKLYVNSDLKASQALSGSINTNFNNLLFGFNFSGLIDEVKVYNTALTSDQVQQIYRSF
ncbi:hypothetical protein AKJ56_00035 [candidate division MSBL1 archaeon SCGC-AAA382N08]|uniref:DUF2341 domain-containing protein n=1 Tax=candidate division MSBL1 archaeon SCGC-AAA382N08 TaxID=1698285 RepID=A0A133VQW2_9EURY|nr:hypothetical protein AKJ56_00035 [candidate division MSBL1 archaeon SCGC-AAA382N08]